MLCFNVFPMPNWVTISTVIARQRNIEHGMELYTRDSVFHQSYQCSFQICGTLFNSVTHYLNYRKAVIFENTTLASMILETDDPIIQTQLGSLIKRCPPTAWMELAHKVFYDATYAKYEQNEELRIKLMETQGKLLVETTIYDSVWGNGMRHDDPESYDIDAWRGSNWGGYLLTEVREKFLGCDTLIPQSMFVITWTRDQLLNDHRSAYTAVDRVKKYSLTAAVNEIIKSEKSCKSCNPRKRKRIKSENIHPDLNTVHPFPG